LLHEHLLPHVLFLLEPLLLLLHHLHVEGLHVSVGFKA
jgi:hypothetical protein